MNDAQTYTEQREARNAGLSALGFDPYFTAGEVFGSQDFATCRTCGAVVHLPRGVPNEDQPVFTHAAWHRAKP